MTHRKGAIWTERLLLGLILVSLAATLNLLLAIHRQAPGEEQAPATAVALPRPSAEVSHRRPAAPAEEPAPPPRSTARRREYSPNRNRPPPPAEDPTQKAVAALAAATAKESQAAAETDRRTLAMEAGYRRPLPSRTGGNGARCSFASRSPASRPRPRSSSAKPTQLDAERDVLERERDATKAALAKASHAVGLCGAAVQGAQRHLAAADRRRMHRRRGQAPTARAQLHDARALAAHPPSIERLREGDRPRAASHSVGRHARRNAGGPVHRFPGAPRRHRDPTIWPEPASSPWESHSATSWSNRSSL